MKSLFALSLIVFALFCYVTASTETDDWNDDDNAASKRPFLFNLYISFLLKS